MIWDQVLSSLCQPGKIIKKKIERSGNVTNNGGHPDDECKNSEQIVTRIQS